MRMAEFRWSQVRANLFIAIAGVILFAAIFYFGLSGTTLSKNATVYGNFDDVSGLGVGSPVEMEGVDVGQVANLELPSVHTGKVAVTLSISHEALERLGASSVAFTSSHALVGQRFIGLTVRKPNEKPLKEGDLVQTRPAHGFENLGSEAGEALAQVKELMIQTQRITTSLALAVESLQQGHGTIGRLLRDESLYTNLNDAAANANKLSRQLTAGQGTLGELLSDRKMADQLRVTMDTLASTAVRVREGKGVLGELTNNQGAEDQLAHALANLDTVTTRLTEAQGTLGALINDRELLAKMNALLGQMDSLVADVRRNPQRYVKLQAF